MRIEKPRPAGSGFGKESEKKLRSFSRRSEAMRDGPWKLVVKHPQAARGSFENGLLELYRLDRDPGEENDLSRKFPQRCVEMLRRLKAWYADTQRTATPQVGGWPS